MTPLAPPAAPSAPRPAPSPDLVGGRRALLDAASAGTCAIDAQGVCHYVNAAAERLLGYPAAELVGRDLHAVVHPTRRDGYPCLAAECPAVVGASTGRPGELEAEDGFWRSDGTFLPIELRLEPVVVDGAPVGAVVTFSEVRQDPGSAEHLPGSLATSTDAFVALDADGVLAAWNPAAQQLLGWSPKEVIGRSCLDLLVPEDEPAPLAGKLAMLSRREGADFPLSFRALRVLSRSGEGVELSATVLRIPWAGGWRFQVFLRDVSALRRAETSLARADAVYRLVVGASRDVISHHLVSGVTSFVSPVVEELFGWVPGELVGRQLTHLVHPEDQADVVAAVVGGDGGGDCTFRVRHSDGRWVWVESTSTLLRDETGRVSEVLVCSRDITARLAREAASHQESKLESLGRLSAGLAHEINTPIQYVGDNARFLSDAFADLMGLVARYRDALADDTATPWAERLPAMRAAEAAAEIGYLETEVPSAIAQTLTGIERVATIVRAMKTFSHPGLDEHEPADLNEALTVTVTVTRHQVRQVADLELELGDLPPVRCNIAELNQVFLNLIVNAADAVEETGRRGTIRVSSAVEGSDVVISVSDTGGGIPEAIRARIFDPFFTTKQVGRGTGQGLPLVRSVVQDAHGGRLSVQTEPGAGTTMTVRLPVAGAPPLIGPPLIGPPLSDPPPGGDAR